VRTTIAFRVIGAVLLLGAAAVARNQADLARGEAAAWQRLITFQYDALSTDEAPSGIVARGVGAVADSRRREATVEYWLGRYDQLAGREGGDADPDVMFVAANAAYRAAWREVIAGRAGAARLDPVIQAYANVLKADPRHADAAFNIELVARRRDDVARQRPVQLAGDDEPRSAGPVRTSDLPRGPTIHGVPGGPPVNVTLDEFEVLIPRDGAAEEAPSGQAPGRKQRRKG